MALFAERSRPTTKPTPLSAKFRLAGLVVIYVLCMITVWRPLDSNSDFWAHAAVGRWIAEHSDHVPTRTLMLWSANIPWVAHSWLSELLIYHMLRSAGESRAPTIALVLTGTLMCGACGLLWFLCRVNFRSFGPSMIVFSLAIYASSERLFARPEIFTTFFCAALMFLLLRRDVDGMHRSRRSLVIGSIVTPMFALWTNLHGGVLVGLIVVWVYAILEVAQEGKSLEALQMVGVAAACTCATLANPYGVRYYGIYRAVGSLTFRHIIEWRPLFESPYLDCRLILPVGLLAIIGPLLWLITPARRWSHIVWLVVFACMAVAARRNIMFLNLAALAVAVPYLRALGNDQDSSPKADADQASADGLRVADGVFYMSERQQVWTVPAALVVLAAALPALDWFGTSGLPSAKSSHTADGLCAELTSMDFHGRVFNYYDNASYLEWRLGNGAKLYIDGINAYPDSLFRDYNSILSANPRGLELLDDEHVDCVIGRPGPVFDRLYYAIAESPSWALVYYGDDGPVWVRRLPQYRSSWESVPVYGGGHNWYNFISYLRTRDHKVSRM